MSVWSLIELQEEVKTLRTLLNELRQEWSELNQSYLRQKKAARFWRVTAVVAIAAAAVEGLVIGLSR
ncbi:MAG: hypothetical protein IJ191_00860 [Treponema sp.]|nr:hypothetical protein [Treponema sp.]